MPWCCTEVWDRYHLWALRMENRVTQVDNILKTISFTWLFLTHSLMKANFKCPVSLKGFSTGDTFAPQGHMAIYVYMVITHTHIHIGIWGCHVVGDMECCWHLAGSGHRCCWTSCDTQMNFIHQMIKDLIHMRHHNMCYIILFNLHDNAKQCDAKVLFCGWGSWGRERCKITCPRSHS